MFKNKLFIIGFIVILAAGAGFWLRHKFYGAKAPENDAAEELNAANAGITAQADLSLKPVEPISAADHVAGNPDAPVKIIVYSDFTCPFCTRFYGTLKEVKEYFNGQVAIVFRHYFLSFSSPSYPAALVSECAAEQGKFWEMYDQLFIANRDNRLNAGQFSQLAVDLGLDETEFNNCLATEKYKDKILAQILAGKSAGVNGTPTVFVNGLILPGAYPFADFTYSDGQPGQGMKSIIEEQLNN